MAQEDDKQSMGETGNKKNLAQTKSKKPVEGPAPQHLAQTKSKNHAKAMAKENGELKKQPNQ